MRPEAVQSMSQSKLFNLGHSNSRELVLVAGWSDNGWLSGGHAVRMAMELCKHSKSAMAMRR